MLPPSPSPNRVKELSLLPITENRIEKLPLVRFLFLSWQMVQNHSFFFGSHCNISAYTQHFELKFGIDTKFDTLIANLN